MAKWINEEALDVLANYYYPRAMWLQQNCNWGQNSYTGPVADAEINDPLMQNIEIYDCFSRDAAGFSNVLQDLWFKHSTPKWHHQDRQRHELIWGYDTSNWQLSMWLWVFMAHRITGSGASFQEDHGYRNNIVQYFGKCDNIWQMVDMMRAWKAEKKSMFTSIGNQPPAPRKGTSNMDFLIHEAPMLCLKLSHMIDHKDGLNTHKEVVDYLNEYNLSKGHRRFNFAYAALSMDISDYFPEFIDPKSHTYLGNNAKRCLKLCSKATRMMR